jgi:FkbM family methyltransferase
LKKIDVSIFSGKPISDVIDFAKHIKDDGLEGKLNAHFIFSMLIDEITNDNENNFSYIRGDLRQEIWDLERFFGWNRKFFSQSGQDKFIHTHFFHSYFEKGFFVDVGAYDGVKGSNSLFFENILGWNGIAIEPAKGKFKDLRENRKCLCINQAVSGKKELVEFIEVTHGYTQMSGLNTKNYSSDYEFIMKDPASKIKKQVMQTTTFDELVLKNKNIDYLSVDIEGGEMDLLQSINFKFYDIKVISIENKLPLQIDYQSYLSGKNFKRLDIVGSDEIYFNKSHFNY